MRAPVYTQSVTYRLLGSVDHLFVKLLTELYRKMDEVTRGSIFAVLVKQLVGAFCTFFLHSVFLKMSGSFAVMPVVPYGLSITAVSILGIVVAGTVFLPTSVVFLLVLICVPIVLMHRLKTGAQLVKWPVPSITVPFLLLFLFLAAATFSSVLPWTSISALIIWCFYGLFFFIAADAARRGDEERLVWPLLTAATIASVIGIAQHFAGGYNPQSWLDQQFEGEIVRVVGTFTNPTFFAEMLGLALPVTIALMLKRKSFWDKVCLLGYSIIQGIALVFTYSRGAWLGFFVSLAVLSVLYEKRMLIVMLIGLILILALAPPILTERLLSSFSLEDSSNNYRVFIWRGSIAMIKSFLFRGVGLGAGCFAYIYPEYMIIQTPAPHAHSVYFQMLIEIGLVGFIVLMAFMAIWTVRTVCTVFTEKGHWQEKWAKTGLLAGVMSAVAGHMVQGLVEHTWYNPRIGVVFWVWMGIGAGLASVKGSLKSQL